MYKGVRYREKPLEEILENIEEMSQILPSTKRVFLADGDALFMPFDKLKAIYEALNSSFPHLSLISMYDNGSCIVDKSEE